MVSHALPSPIIYLIRHGEKPPKLPDGEDANGLSAQGLERAQGLRKVFGKDSIYDIQHIIAEHPKKDGSRDRPYLTILPLSQDLDLEVDKSIDRDDVKGAAEAAKGYAGPGNVLVCWEHGELAKIVEKLGVKEKATYPGDRFDVIWAVKKPYEVLEWVGSEGVPGLDDGASPVGPVGPVAGDD
ncbi:related to phosphoglycerate mutase family protein [Phialocephala subalpina]|uniref:Related to phosphoglycerate mutase family protein n=1 Tax=Phialocephala subalpina TaxID=576137 RepID=A0A1L7WSU0_9HELO|nr:related to phosphoglycerate mutase family protein [Phialocephala subalpina]